MSYFTPKNVKRAVKLAGEAKGWYDLGRSLGSSTKKAVNNYRTRMRAQRIKAIMSKGYGGPSTGVYQGKFRKPKTAKTGKIAKYLTAGNVSYREIYGDINDPDCVYLGFSTYDREEIKKAIFYSIMKKLFKKGGINIDAVHAELPLNSWTNSAGGTLTAVYKLATLITPVSYTLLDNQSLQSLYDADACGLATYIENGYYQVLGVDYTLESVNWNHNSTTLAQLNIAQEVLQLEVFMDIKIQNRTKGAAASAEDGDLDRVDSQPIKGKLYEFVGGVPKERQKGMTALNFMATTAGGAIGVQLARAAQLSPNREYDEPPPAKHFQNCIKASGVLLNPAMIKRHGMKWYCRGYLNNILQKWRNLTSAGVNYSAPGKSCLFAFEEVLNSGSTNKITCSYEVDRKTCAMLITAKPYPMKPVQSVLNVSNVV